MSVANAPVVTTGKCDDLRVNNSETTSAPLLRQLRRRWLIIAAVTIVAGGAAYGISSATHKTYTATALLLAQPNSPETALLGGAVAVDSGTQARALATIQDLGAGRTVAATTSRTLGGSLTPTQVQSEVKTTVDPNANAITVSTIDSQPDRAARLANTFAQAFINADAQQRRAAASTALIELQAGRAALTAGSNRAAAKRTLTDQIARLRELKLAGPSQLSLTQPAAVPTVPNSSTVRNTVLGALFGLLLGCGIALVREQDDRRVRKEENLEAETGLPILAEVPNSKSLRRGRPVAKLTPGEAEAFRMLWMRLRFGFPDRAMNRVLITSAGPKEGKSTVSWYLASVAAAGGGRVLLIEADVRRPVLQERFGVEPRAGLMDVLRDGVPLAEAITEVLVAGPEANGNLSLALVAGLTRGRSLDVLVAGGHTNELSGISTTDRLLELLRDGVAGYDLVVIDSPPVGLAAESIALLAAVDGVLITSRPGLTDRDGLMDLVSELKRFGSPPLGIVFDGREVQSYGYYARSGRSSGAPAQR